MTNKENSINKLMALCSFIHFLTHSFTRSGCKLFQELGSHLPSWSLGRPCTQLMPSNPR